jgi:hypothetical protein
MNALEKIRPWFLGRSRREKLLAVAFLLVLAGLWFYSLAGRMRAFTQEVTMVRRQSSKQADVLNRRAEIDASYAAAVARLKDQELPTGAQAYAKVDEIVRKYPYAFRIDPLQSRTSDNLTYNNINVSLQKADYQQLAKLFGEITAALPTINLDEITLTADRRNPAQLDARLKFVAIEFNR